MMVCVQWEFLLWGWVGSDSSGSQTTVERLKIIQRSPLQNVVVQRSIKGPETEFLGFPALRIFAKSFLSSCGATFCKGPEFLAEIF
jgi:hypothetical protein